MARHWREQLDADRHVDWMRTIHVGGFPATPPSDPLIETWVYFVEVCSFRYEFVSIDQIRECLEYFEERHHGSSRLPGNELEHYWQRWFEKLPRRLLRNQSRVKVVKALEAALSEFGGG